jgi:hypothetical protein
MMPLSYQGFGITTILLMVAILVAGQLFRHLKERLHKHSHQKK